MSVEVSHAGSHDGHQSEQFHGQLLALVVPGLCSEAKEARDVLSALGLGGRSAVTVLQNLGERTKNVRLLSYTNAYIDIFPKRLKK